MTFGLQSSWSTYITSNDLFPFSPIIFVSQNRINRRKFKFDVRYYVLTHVIKMLFVYGSSLSLFICRIRHFQTKPIVRSSNVLTFKWKPVAHLGLFLLKQITIYWALIDKHQNRRQRNKGQNINLRLSWDLTIKFRIYFDSWFETDDGKTYFHFLTTYIANSKPVCCCNYCTTIDQCGFCTSRQFEHDPFRSINSH